MPVNPNNYVNARKQTPLSAYSNPNPSSPNSRANNVKAKKSG